MKKLELYTVKGGKKLRCGYTTGSCAAAAAKAAVLLIEGKLDSDIITINTPKGVELEIEIEKVEIEKNYSAITVKKDSGDDPDVTNEIEIVVKANTRNDKNIIIEGGKGVGIITIDGFWGKKGDSAINPIPKKMIEEEIRKVSDKGYNIEIEVPKGEEIAKKTFNSNIGIIGGISIIGTTGIVEPMSEEAFKKCIFLEIDKINEIGSKEITLYPGNYGEKIAKEIYENIPGVQMANFIGETVLYCEMKKFERIILIGHIGKFSKLSLGAFNTHSKTCDMRIEAFIYYLALKNDFEAIQDIKEFRTSEEVIKYLFEKNKIGIIKDMKKGCIDRIKNYIKDENIKIEVIIYSMEYGIIS